MSYDKKIISQILRDLETKRDLHESEAVQRRQELYRRFPRLNVIDRELRSTAAKAMRIAFESNNTSAEIDKLRHRNMALQAEKRAILIQNNYDANYLSPDYDCPFCHDTGYCGNKLCQCVKRKSAELQTKQLSSVLPIRNGTFEHFNLNYYSDTPSNRFGIPPRVLMRVNLTQCKNFAENFGSPNFYENLLLYGSPGLGKTFLSSCIAHRVIERGFTVTYDTAISIFEEYSNIKFNTTELVTTSKQLERFRNADLLIIDDLGTETESPQTTSCWYDLINGRIMHRRPTILSTNYKPDELEGRYSSAIISRILGEFTQLRFIGEDIRKIRKKQRL